MKADELATRTALLGAMEINQLRAELEQAKADAAGYEEWWLNCQAERDAAKAELAQVRQERDRLREALDDYGEHLPRCKFWDNEDCSCGYRAALNGAPERAP